MKDSLQQALAALDDARTILYDLYRELPITDFNHTALMLAYDDVDRAIGKVKGVAK